MRCVCGTPLEWVKIKPQPNREVDGRVIYKHTCICGHTVTIHKAREVPSGKGPIRGDADQPSLP